MCCSAIKLLSAVARAAPNGSRRRLRLGGGEPGGRGRPVGERLLEGEGSFEGDQAARMVGFGSAGACVSTYGPARMT